MYYGGGETIDERFEKNLSSLSTKNPVLTQRLTGLHLKPQWEVFQTEDGLKTVKKLFGECHSCCIHSCFSPKKEAERWAALVRNQSDTSIIFGLGLGYHLLELQRNTLVKTLVIIEADLELFYLAIKITDLTPIIQHPKTHLLISEKIPVIKDFFNNFPQSSISYREYLPSTGLHSEYYRSAKEILEGYMFNHRVQKHPELSQGIMRLLDESKN
jgi:hypothetical protein